MSPRLEVRPGEFLWLLYSGQDVTPSEETTPLSIGLTWQNLILVNERIQADPLPREYDIIPLASGSSTPSNLTPPYPDPMNPVEFFRTLSLSKEAQLRYILDPGASHRDAINHAEYWRCEAKFWATQLGAKETDREKIEDAEYWRCEASFWETAWKSKQGRVDRFQILDTSYWKSEAYYWKSKLWTDRDHCHRTSLSEISDKRYWERENEHYNIILDLLQSKKQIAQPCNDLALAIDNERPYDSASAERMFGTTQLPLDNRKTSSSAEQNSMIMLPSLAALPIRCPSPCVKIPSISVLDSSPTVQARETSSAHHLPKQEKEEVKIINVTPVTPPRRSARLRQKCIPLLIAETCTKQGKRFSVDEGFNSNHRTKIRKIRTSDR